MILVFAETYEHACTRCAAIPKNEWKYVQSIKDVRGWTNVEILDLGGWRSDLEKIDAWDIVHLARKEEVK